MQIIEAIEMETCPYGGFLDALSDCGVEMNCPGLHWDF